MKKAIALLLACVLCLSFTACSGGIQGNTNGNITNGGLVAAAGDRIYFSNLKDSGKLYVMKPDGSDQKKLNDDNSLSISVVGSKIYYINGDDDNNIYSMKTDGSNRRKLSNDGKVFRITMAGGRIYYSTSDGSAHALYSMKPDGSDQKTLNNDVWFFNVAAGRIYYEGSSGGKLYSMKPDGSDQREVSSQIYPGLILASGDRVYYKDYTNKIHAVSINGGGDRTLSSDLIGFFNVAGNRIYYSNQRDNGKLYVMDTDGNNVQKLCDDTVGAIYMAGNRIYFQSVRGLYSIKTDGTDRQQVN